jgi:hypothetical protein
VQQAHEGNARAARIDHEILHTRALRCPFANRSIVGESCHARFANGKGGDPNAIYLTSLADVYVCLLSGANQ